MRRRPRRFLDGEQLQLRYCLAALAFIESDLECCSAHRTAFAVDIDNDRDLDVLSTSNGRIAWYENTDGAGHFSDQPSITTESTVDSFVAADVDGDGDPDVLVSTRICFGEIQQCHTWRRHV